MIVVIGLFVGLATNSTKRPVPVSKTGITSNETTETTQPIKATVTPEKPTPTPSKYSEELKAKVRSNFISTCNSKGHYGIPVCTCGADYLSKNYSESDLAEMYLQYHSTNQPPAALQKALDFCTKK